jgi:hypothetical protein
VRPEEPAGGGGPDDESLNQPGRDRPQTGGSSEPSTQPRVPTRMWEHPPPHWRCPSCTPEPPPIGMADVMLLGLGLGMGGTLVLPYAVLEWLPATLSARTVATAAGAVGTAARVAQSLNEKLNQGLGTLMRGSQFVPTQTNVSRERVIRYAEQMLSGQWSWSSAAVSHRIIVDPVGNIISGHHRIVAAALANMRIPDAMIYRMSTVTHRVPTHWSNLSIGK